MPRRTEADWTTANRLAEHANLAASRGHHFDAALKHQAAFELTGKASLSGSSALAAARAALRMGHLRRATLLFEACLCEEPMDIQCAAKLGSLATLRLSGDRVAARALEAWLKEEAGGWPADLRGALIWQSACLDTMESGSVETMFKALSAPELKGSADWEADFQLWAYASKSRHWRHRGKRRAAGAANKSRPGTVVTDCLTLIEAMYATDTLISARIDAMDQLLSLRTLLPELDQELLVLAIAVRWAVRHNQDGLADLALSEYRGWVLKLTEGTATDLHRLAKDVPLKAMVSPALDTGYQIGKPSAHDSSSYREDARAWTESVSTAVRVACLVTKGMITTKSKGTGTNGPLASQKDIARVLFGYARQRRGVMFRLGRFLNDCASSDFLGPIGEELRAEYELCGTQLVTMPPQTVQQIFRENFGQSPTEVFRHWNDEPFASGTIGQVHAAETWEGEKVAVKVRYAGIKSVIAADMQQGKIVARFLKSRFPGVDFSALVMAYFACVNDETDYRRELANHKLYRRLFGTGFGIRVPKPYEHLSRASVLTTELIEGEHFKTFCQSGAQTAKNQAGAAILQVHYHALLKHGLVLPDLHQDNVLFVAGEAVLIDFGSVRHLPNKTFVQRRQLLQAIFRGDVTRTAEACRLSGSLPTDFAVDEEVIFKHYSAKYSPFLTGEPFTFTPSYASEQLRTETFGHPFRFQVGLNAEQLFIPWVEWMLYPLLGALQAEQRWNGLLEPLLQD